VIVIHIAKEFNRRLINRTGDTYAADEFRESYLKFLDNKEAWERDDTEIELDFSNIQQIRPSFANEAFGYFKKYASMQQILTKIKFSNVSVIQMLIIKQELSDVVMHDDQRMHTINSLKLRITRDVEELNELMDTCPHNEVEQDKNKEITYITCRICKQDLPLEILEIYKTMKVKH